MSGSRFSSSRGGILSPLWDSWPRGWQAAVVAPLIYLKHILQFSHTMENDTVFSKAAGRKIIKSQTDKRVSDDAAIELIQELEAYGEELAQEADGCADHAKRKTVQASDMRQARKNRR